MHASVRLLLCLGALGAGTAALARNSTVSVTLSGASSPISCTPTSRDDIFLCPIPTTGEQVLIWNESSIPENQTSNCEGLPTWNGIKLSSLSQVEPQSIREVIRGGERQRGNSRTPQAPFSAQTVYEFHVQGLPKQLRQLEGAGAFVDNARRAQQYYIRTNITFANQTTVRIENQNTRCTRARSSDRALRAGFGACPYLICDPVRKNDESFTPLHLSDGPALQHTTLIGEQRLGNRINEELREHNDHLVQNAAIQRLARCNDPALTALFRRKEELVREEQAKVDRHELREIIAHDGGLVKKVLVTSRIAQQQGRELPDGLYASNSLDSFELQHYLLGTPSYFLPSLLREEATVLSEAEANDLFLEISRMSDIPWFYYADGCGDRAEVVSLRMEARHINTLKAWAHSTLLSPDSDPGVHWSYHVAPAVAVTTADGTVQARVLDPALADHPLTPEAWVALISPDDLPPPVLTSFPPPSQGIFRRPTLSFSPGLISNVFSPRRSSRFEQNFNLRSSQGVLNRHSTLSCGNRPPR